MENKQIIDEIDISKCEFCEDSKYCYIYSGTADFKWLCEENEDCQIKNLLLQLKAKEQECEKFEKDLHLNFKEKDKLHLIIDRLLEASGYDTNTASAKDFEDVYKNMRYEKQQLDQLKQILAKIKEICNNNDELQGDFNLVDCDKYKLGKHNLANKILQKISECKVKYEN